MIGLCLVNSLNAQEFMHLIGLDVDNSELAKYSYSIMYDSEKRDSIADYRPYSTIGIYRVGDRVEIKQKDYLIIPTLKGFKYATLSVKEFELDSNSLAEFDPLPEGDFELESSTIEPIFFEDQKEIEKYLPSVKPVFQDALSISFERFSYVHPLFYTTQGFESYVHGGASGFNAVETMNIYPLDWDREKEVSNKVLDYLSNEVKNDLVIRTLTAMEDYGFEYEAPDVNEALPWAGSINEHDKVYFDFEFSNNGTNIIPYTLLQGNSSRAFLEAGPVIEDDDLYYEFNVQKAEDHSALVFISPDEDTKTVISDQLIEVYDIEENTLLKSYRCDFNKVIMSEYAVGEDYAKKWNYEFFLPSDPIPVLDVFLYGEDRTRTNIRNKPNGEIVLTIKDEEDYIMLELIDAKDGWFEVKSIDSVDGYDIEIPGGTGWIHHSQIGAGTRRNINLLDQPAKGKIVGKIEMEEGVRILDMLGEWVKVEYKGMKGWMDSYYLCGNPVTTCP